MGVQNFCTDGEVVRNQLEEADGRDRLAEFLRIRDVQPERDTAVVARFDALLTIVAAVLDGRNQTLESPLEFAPLMHVTTFRVVDTGTGSHRIAVNRDLASAPLPLLSATLIEALLWAPVATGVDLGMVKRCLPLP